LGFDFDFQLLLLEILFLNDSLMLNSLFLYQSNLLLFDPGSFHLNSPVFFDLPLFINRHLEVLLVTHANFVITWKWIYILEV